MILDSDFVDYMAIHTHASCVMCHPSLASKVRKLHMGSNSL